MQHSGHAGRVKLTAETQSEEIPLRWAALCECGRHWRQCTHSTAQHSVKLHSYWTILQLPIFVNCQCGRGRQEKSIQKNGACNLSQTNIWKIKKSFVDIVLCGTVRGIFALQDLRFNNSLPFQWNVDWNLCAFKVGQKHSNSTIQIHINILYSYQKYSQ